MRRKIILFLIALFAIFITGILITILYITNSVATLNKQITMHQIEILREELIINIQTVQSNLYAYDGPLAVSLDSIVANVAKLENSAKTCSTCHHPPDVYNKINAVQGLVGIYKATLSNYITASANTQMMDKLRSEAAAVGNQMLMSAEEMSFIALTKLKHMSSAALKRLNNAWRLLFLLLMLAILLGIMIAVYLVRFMMRPINDLLMATKEIASGNLGYTTSYRDKTEFGALADSFNKMSATLKEQRENIRRHQEQLMQSQKMESLGLLAGGIAHDFNNILTAITGYSYLLQQQVSGNEKAAEYLKNVIAASERAKHLTQGLLAFSRRQIMNPSEILISNNIKEISAILERLISEDIEFSIKSSGAEFPVFADSYQIEQVVMNLVTNARDAMPSGGRLSLETSSVMLDSEIADKRSVKPGRYMVISVSDTGSGIDDEHLAHIFEPFYTTKEKGKGTGLGLSMAYGIIKQHGGFINVYSEKDSGTTFRIYLPALEGSEAPDKAAAPPAAQDNLAGNERILIAEDEESIREFLKDALEGYGYRIILSADGEEAIAKYVEERESLDLVLLDVIMPRKNGKEVYKYIKEIDPRVKVIFMSGYPQDILTSKGIYEEGLVFIPKPLEINTLLNKIREVLSKS